MITISFDPTQIVTWLIIGLIAGFLASVLVRGRRMGYIASIIVGLIGAVIGGTLFRLLNISIPGGITLAFTDIVAALVGAVIVLAIVVLLFNRR